MSERTPLPMSGILPATEGQDIFFTKETSDPGGRRREVGEKRAV